MYRVLLDTTWHGQTNKKCSYHYYLFIFITRNIKITQLKRVCSGLDLIRLWNNLNKNTKQVVYLSH